MSQAYSGRPGPLCGSRPLSWAGSLCRRCRRCTRLSLHASAFGPVSPSAPLAFSLVGGRALCRASFGGSGSPRLLRASELLFSGYTARRTVPSLCGLVGPLVLIRALVGIHMRGLSLPELLRNMGCGAGLFLMRLFRLLHVFVMSLGIAFPCLKFSFKSVRRVAMFYGRGVRQTPR